MEKTNLTHLKDRAVESAGGVRELARALGITRNAVLMWRCVPERHVYRVAQLQRDYSAEQLRPDLFQLQADRPVANDDGDMIHTA